MPATDENAVSAAAVISRGPDPWSVHLRVEPVGFCSVSKPTTLPGLAGTCVTGRP
ncbi:MULTISPECIES: hypothetical protein [Streptomyces]|uniref:hypothetical protein n=1 Tax=Streptomyces TaxID=1883 RepID=UPI0016797707|nr:hypothetical protein [Streptomyces canarius]